MNLFLVLALLSQDAASQPAASQPFEPQGFRSQLVVEINAPRAEVWEAATGNVTPWWDHSFAEAPAELVIEPRFGGRFFERSTAGSEDGALHATIIYVDAPQSLRMNGPLGLSGRALDLVSSWTLEEIESGEATRFTVDLSMVGEIDAPLADIVYGVWAHFIADRLKPYVEAGCHLEPEAPCAAFAE